MSGRLALTPPKACALWSDPERLREGVLATHFKREAAFEHESHWWRDLLVCRECGQRYLYEFYEEIDWEKGEDPQLCTWLPVFSEAEIATLRRLSPAGFHAVLPRLVQDFPKGAEKPAIFWAREKISER